MTAIVTDVRYRMSLSLIRDLARQGIRVVAVERDDRPGPYLGFYSAHTAQTHLLSGARYMDELEALCRRVAEEEGECPALLPVGAETLALLSEGGTRAQLADCCGLHLPPRAQLDLLNDKAQVAQLAQSLDIPVPLSYARQPDETAEAFCRRLSLPVVIKPLCGEALGLHAQQRYAICRTAEAAVQWFDHFARLEGVDPIVQDYLPGGGVGCSVLADRGTVVSCLCHRRVREYPVSGGPSSCCRSIHSQVLEGWAARMAEELTFSGLMMLEFKLDGADKPRLLEINPRIWGSFPLTRAAGSPMAVNWFCLAWNGGNPGRTPLPLIPDHTRERTMHFAASDLMAGIGYLRRRGPGDLRRGLGALGCLFDPAVRDGLWSWGDPKPALAYYRSLLGRGRGQ